MGRFVAPILVRSEAVYRDGSTAFHRLPPSAKLSGRLATVCRAALTRMIHGKVRFWVDA
jgi:hypothetical protein